MNFKSLFVFIFCIVLSQAMLATSVDAQSLSPKDRTNLRNARNAAMSFRNQVDRMEYAIAEWQRLGSQVGNSRVEKFNADADEAVVAYNKANEIIPQLPAGVEEVDTLISNLAEQRTRYENAIAEAKALIEGANKAVENVGGRAAINADIERLSEIAYQFSPFAALITSYPEDALALILEYKPAMAEIKSFEEKYDDFLKQNNADTAPVKRKLQDARATVESVATTARERAAAIREAAMSDLDRTEELIATGLRDRKPAYFGKDSGIEQHLGYARQRAKLARAIDSEAAQPVVERYLKVKAKADEAGQSLKTEIIAANQGPEDNYRGNDRDALIKEVEKAWLKANPDDEIAAIRIPTANWTRINKWYWDSGTTTWYRVDRSKLQASVIIEAENENGQPELHFYPVDISRNHLNNDVISYSPWEKEELEDLWVHSRMLPENL